MTKAELVKALEQYPDEIEVVVRDGDEYEVWWCAAEVFAADGRIDIRPGEPVPVPPAPPREPTEFDRLTRRYMPGSVLLENLFNKPIRSE